MSSQTGKKVFLVEDNLEVSRMYERAFRLNGFEIEIAHDGETALQKISSEVQLPSVIIMDVMMPHMNGIELLKELRADPRFARVPIAVLTNSFKKDESEKFMTLGADLYLIKIENQSKEIVEKIDSLISKYQEMSHE